jgi:hypothetical protein
VPRRWAYDARQLEADEEENMADILDEILCALDA